MQAYLAPFFHAFTLRWQTLLFDGEVFLALRVGGAPIGVITSLTKVVWIWRREFLEAPLSTKLVQVIGCLDLIVGEKLSKLSSDFQAVIIISVMIEFIIIPQIVKIQAST